MVLRVVLLVAVLAAVVSNTDAVCESDWVYHNGYCYWSSLYQNSSPKTNWFNAQLDCRRKGSELASIHNLRENHFVSKLTRCSNTWNGLVMTDYAKGGAHSSWQWINTRHRDYINWYSGFPRISGGYNTYSCAYVSASHQEKWLQGRCGIDQLHYVCSKQTTGKIGVNTTMGINHKVQGACKRGWYMLGQKCYHLNNTKVDFFAALLNCQSKNAKLITLHSNKESADLSSMFDDCETPWLGLENTDPNNVNKNSGWRWNDNTLVDYSNWESNVPTNDRAKQCATFQMGTMWKNRNCWELHPFVCESHIPDN